MQTGLTILCAALLAGCGNPATEANAVEPAATSTAPTPAARPSDARRADVVKALIDTVGELGPKARAAIGYADIGGDDREEALVYLVVPVGVAAAAARWSS